MQRFVSTVTKSFLSEFTLDSGLCGRQKLKQVKQVDLGHTAVNSILASEVPVCFRAICQRGLVTLSPTRTRTRSNAHACTHQTDSQCEACQVLETFQGYGENLEEGLQLLSHTDSRFRSIQQPNTSAVRLLLLRNLLHIQHIYLRENTTHSLRFDTGLQFDGLWCRLEACLSLKTIFKKLLALDKI